MDLRDVRTADLDNKRVLMRVDFNVEFENGKPKEKYKILSAKETIELVLSKPGVKLALLSHWGRPEKKKKDFSFENFYRSIAEILQKDIVFVDDSIGEKVKNAMDALKEGQVLLLENVRFYEEDAVGDEDFSRKLADNFEIYVNEAFSVSHRVHASVTKIMERLPSFAGITFQKEIEELNKVRVNFQNPAIAIIGGAKIETKLPVIKFFADKYEVVLVGGKIGLEAANVHKVLPGNVILPEDYEGGGLDVGPKTIKRYVEYVKASKTIVWNGPLGKFETPPYEIGTVQLLEAVINNIDAYKVIGGGETVQIVEERDLIWKFNFVSTGGGAMLEFIAQGTLPAIEMLKI